LLDLDLGPLSRIGLLLVLIYSASTLLATSDVRATGRVAIHDNLSTYYDNSGYLHVVGEVENVGDSDISFVRLTASFYDSNDTIVGTDFTYAMLDILPPKTKSPFEITLSDRKIARKVDHVRVVGAFQETLQKLSRTLLIPSHSSHTDSLGYLNIVGEIKNNGTQPSTYTKIVVTCYDNSGKVVAVDFSYIDPKNLNHGQRAPFKMTIDKDRSSQVAKYELLVESNEAILIPEFTSILPLLTLVCLLALTILRKRRGHFLISHNRHTERCCLSRSFRDPLGKFYLLIQQNHSQ